MTKLAVNKPASPSTKNYFVIEIQLVLQGILHRHRRYLLGGNAYDNEPYMPPATVVMRRPQ